MEIENSAIEYRLTGIEKTLTELKDVVVNNKMLDRDMKEVKKDVEDALKAINAHEQRIRAVEERPIKEKAGRWSLITDNFLKLIIATTLAFMLAKIGLTQGGV